MTDLPDGTPERKSSDDKTLEALDFSVSRRVPSLVEGDVGVVSDAALTHYRHALTAAVVEVGELTIAARRALLDKQDVADVSGSQFHPIWMDTWEITAVAFASSVDDVLDTIDLSVLPSEQGLMRHVVARMYANRRDFDSVQRILESDSNSITADMAARYVAPRMARDGLLERAIALADRYVQGDTRPIFSALVVEDALSRDEIADPRLIQTIDESPVRHAVEQSVLEYRIDRNCGKSLDPMRGISTFEVAAGSTAIRRVLRWNGARVRNIEQCDAMMRRYELQADKVSAAYEVGFGSGLTLNEASRTVVARVAGPVEQLAMHHGYILGIARTITRLQQAHG